MRVAVIGSRTFTNYKLLADTLIKFESEPPTFNFKPILSLAERRDSKNDVEAVALHGADDSVPVQTEPNQKITAIISGGAQGADKLAEVFAKANGTAHIEF